MFRFALIVLNSQPIADGIAKTATDEAVAEAAKEKEKKSTRVSSFSITTEETKLFDFYSVRSIVRIST
ncbi:hypothetical protein Y032_0009g625 [Ancylostoma ceylanicum]|uniref:Uncharacterized protein n=1 Tax=Ancylostoma ceylanicum TaxID=53326 RepID=A0A016VIM7_9BILA|nr:hypothetical protein Y032_0009g625 [Ancylostoma ceylanicum]